MSTWPDDDAARDLLLRSASGNARGRASRQRLLDAASACFGELGYARVRVTDVTTRAHLSHGAFYRHFRDKNHLLLEAMGGPLDALLQATGPQDGTVLDEASVIEATTRFFAVYAEHRGILRVLREIAATHDPELTKLWLDVRRGYVARIEGWLKQLGIPSQARSTIDAALLAEALGAVLDQLAYTRLGLASADPDPTEIEALGRAAGYVWARSLGL